MQVKGIAFIVVGTVLSGCGTQSIAPELVDRSGKYDGNMIMAFHSKGGLQAYGRQHFTCNTAAYDAYYWVDQGEVYLPGKYSSPVGSIAKDGRFYINYESGGYTNLDTGRKTPSYVVLEGQFQSGLTAEGEMVIGKFYSKTGCKYSARGFVYKTNEDKQKLNPHYSTQSITQNVKLIWGNQNISGDLTISERTVSGAMIDVAYLSAESGVDCYGSLRMITGDEGRWKIKCSDSRKASGSYIQSKKYWSISGEDSQGNSVTAYKALN